MVDKIIEKVKKNYPDFKDEKDLICKELSDGNINYVYRIENNSNSIIVKHSTCKIRTSGNYLNPSRLKLEAKALKILGEEFAPKIFNYDEDDNILIMQDLKTYENLRFALLNKKEYKALDEKLAVYLSKSLFYNSFLYLDANTIKQRVKEFDNKDMSQITKDLVLTEPFNNYKNRNIVSPGLESFVEKEIYNDKSLFEKVLLLKDSFTNNKQTLIHGDLHTGSIFIDSDIKVIDAEFACYGPIAFDIGILIANLFFSLAYQNFYEKNESLYLEALITNVYEKTFRYLEDLCNKFVNSKNIVKNFIKDVKRETCGFIGCELIRRVIGDTKVYEISSIENKSVRLEMEKTLIKLGKSLINKEENDLIMSYYLYSNKRYDNDLAPFLKFENIASYENNKVYILNRSIYPREFKKVECKTYQEVCYCIKNMITQSEGPYIAASYGLVLSVYQARNEKDIKKYVENAYQELTTCRVTTEKQMKRVVKEVLDYFYLLVDTDMDFDQMLYYLKAKAFSYINNNYKKYSIIGKNLASLIKNNSSVLTYCFAGTIVGTFLRELKKQNKNVKIICCETRPYFQGSKLTSSVASDMGFETVVICDNMVCTLLDNKEIDYFTTDSDVITINGCVINKVGTLGVATLCKKYNIPYYVTGTPDINHKDLSLIKIEHRDPNGVLRVNNVKITNDKVKGYYPAFDITKKDLITKVITDKGIFKPNKLKKYFKG